MVTESIRPVNDNPGHMTTKRPYILKSRAQRQFETRSRIIEAAEALHGTIGPSRTTVSEIARITGVQRLTVYNHFPTEAALLEACSAHWVASHPPPAIDGWEEIPVLHERAVEALTKIYTYFAHNQATFANVLRDAEAIPELEAVVAAGLGAYLDRVATVLARGSPARGRRRIRLRATIGLALQFASWRRLAHGGLDPYAAATLMADLIDAAA